MTRTRLRIRGRSLRDYQVIAVARALKARRGVVQLPTGAGKTECGLELISRVGRRALVLVHTSDLLEQWLDRARARMPDAVLGRVPSDIGRADLTIATVQACAAQRASLQPGQVDVVIVDEGHHTPAATWLAVLRRLAAPHVWALTATPERADGREATLYRAVGPVVAHVGSGELERVGAVLAPEVVYVPTAWEPSGVDPRGELVTDARRNEVIVRLVRRSVRDRRTVLVLVERPAHVDELVDALRRQRVVAAGLDGTRSRAERSCALSRVRTGAIRVLVATSVADEGLDLPEADTAILAVPSAVPGRTLQRIGRILRPGRSKQRPIVYDLVDASESAVSAARKRDAVYLEKNWTLSAGAPRRQRGKEAGPGHTAQRGGRARRAAASPGGVAKRRRRA